MNVRDAGVLYLNLQAVLDLAYERGTYALTLDYAREPAVPLADDAHRWAKSLLDSRQMKP